MRIAVPQYTFSKDHKRMLRRALDEVADAGAQGADLACFPPWFVALNPVAGTGGDLTTQLCEAARASHVAILTGNIRIPAPQRKSWQISLLVNEAGKVVGDQKKMILYKAERAWVLPGERVTPVETSWGRLCVLNGLAAISPQVLQEIAALLPDILVLQHACAGAEPLAELKRLAQRLSTSVAPTVIVPLMLGTWYGEHLIGGSFIAASPTYNLNVTGLTKTFIDRCHPYYHYWGDVLWDDRLAGRVGGMIGVYGTQGFEGQVMTALGAFFGGRGMEIVDEMLVFSGEGLSDADRERAFALGRKVATHRA